jgi:hypothetical protein
MGLAVRGKASSHGVAMPTRWTPWPVEAVRIRLGDRILANCSHLERIGQS